MVCFHEISYLKYSFNLVGIGSRWIFSLATHCSIASLQEFCNVPTEMTRTIHVYMQCDGRCDVFLRVFLHNKSLNCERSQSMHTKRSQSMHTDRLD